MIGRTPDLDDLDREIRDHIDAETDDNITRGMSQEDARAAAIRKFGNVTRVKEDVREVWVPHWLDALRQDIRDAGRHLKRSPGFATTVALTLALGIGLTTAIFSVVNAVLIKPLDYPRPDRLVWLTTVAENSKRPEMNSIDFAEWQAQSTSFAHMVAYTYSDATVVVSGQGARLRVINASEGFWAITGAQPLLGALPDAKDRQVVVLAHHAFRERFGGDPKIIGQAVTIDGRPAVIGGVLPADFAPQLMTPPWRPGIEQPPPDAYRGMVVQPAPKVFTPTTQVQLFLVMGELKPGLPIEQARSEIETIQSRTQSDRPTPFGKSSARVVPLAEGLIGTSRFPLQLLLASALCVLIITCANVANMLLSRSSTRQKEIALRMSVGGGPVRLVRQLLAESLAYAALGCVGGVLFAAWLVNAVIGVIGPGVPRLAETTLDLRVMAFSAGVAIVTALLFGLGPAIALCRTNVQEILKEGSRSASASKRALVTGRAMVAVQLALTIVLLSGAGLMFKSIWRMTSYPPGFEPGQILTMRVDFRGPQYREPQARHDYATALLTKAKTLPGVRDAALTTGRESIMTIVKEGEPLPTDRSAHEAPVSSVSPGFGPMLGMTLVSGRWLSESDDKGAAVVNEALARREYPEGNAVGSRIRMPWIGEDGLGTIVGVAADLKYAELDTAIAPELFFHYTDVPLFGVTLAMRIDKDPSGLAPNIAKALSQIDPTQSFFSVRTMEQALDESIAPRRFNLFLLVTFAIAATLLAVVGVYGVVSYAVAERTREIGIRLALGAERSRVVRMIVSQGMLGVGAGIIGGLFGAAAATRLIAGLLYGVEAYDLPTFAITTLLLAVIAGVACTAPALKAALVDPVNALRAE